MSQPIGHSRSRGNRGNLVRRCWSIFKRRGIQGLLMSLSCRDLRKRHFHRGGRTTLSISMGFHCIPKMSLLIQLVRGEQGKWTKSTAIITCKISRKILSSPRHCSIQPREPAIVSLSRKIILLPWMIHLIRNPSLLLIKSKQFRKIKTK